jgi:hypothetical protein
MKQMSLRTFAIATSAFACATLLSFSWSEQRALSLSVESAQARVGRPLTPVSVAGVARRQNRRAAYNAAGMAGPEAANYFGLASAAGTPVVAAGTVGTGPYGGIGPNYYGYGYGGRDWKTYAARNNLACTPGTTFKGPDGRQRLCQ